MVDAETTSEEDDITTITAVVPAAGCGARAALNGNKILAPLWEGQSVLFWALRAIIEADHARLGARLEEIVISARREEFSLIEESLAQLEFTSWKIVEGGATRQDSVQNAVAAAQGEFILVHDAARPCVSGRVIEATLEAALQNGAAIAALPVSDTVKMARQDEKAIDATIDRRLIWLAQTPQIFRRATFLDALQKANEEKFQGTDCSSIMEWAGEKISLVEGEFDNLKVTFGPDLARAASIVANRAVGAKL